MATDTAPTSRGFGLRAHLVALSLALLLPALGLGAVVVWSAAEAYRAAYQEHMQDTAHAIALGVDREIGTFESALTRLAGSPLLESAMSEAGNPAFLASAKTIGEAFGSWVVVFGPGPDYPMRINTAMPPGTALPLGRDLPAFGSVPEVFRTGHAAIGGMAIRRPVGRPVAVIVVPVVRQGRVIAAISMPLDPERIQHILRSHGFAGDLLAVVVDSDYNYVARSGAHERFVGRLVAGWYREATAGRVAGFQRATRLDGTEIVLAFASVPSAAGWRVSVSQPVALFAANWRHPLDTLIVGGTLVVGLGMTLAVLLARRLLHPLRELAGYAEAIATTPQGMPPPPPASSGFTTREYEALRAGFVAAGATLREQAASEHRAADAARSHQNARAESEARLARLNHELTDRVEEEIGRREAAQVRAAQAERMQVLGQLAGGIAHDFNNVLQGIQGAAALIERDPGDPPEIRRFARMVLECAGRGASVTRRLLTFARQGDLRAEMVEVAELLHGLHAILTPALGSPISVMVELDVNMPPLLADKSQLETALLNLATNARDAMESGGTLTLAARAETVWPGVEHPARLPPGRYVRLSVTDTGTGIDAETCERMYEPFFTTKPVGVGTGLGLPMAKSFAEQSGGGLQLTSELGRGTTVELWMPQASAIAAPRATETETKAAAPPASVTNGARVLLVDDDDLVRETLTALLEGGGHEVTCACSGAEAVAIFDTGDAFDMLVTDLSMPGMDGLTLVRAIHARRANLPAMLLTGYAGDTASLAVTGAISASFSLLQKPVTERQLLTRVAALLEPVPVCS